MLFCDNDAGKRSESGDEWVVTTNVVERELMKTALPHDEQQTFELELQGGQSCQHQHDNHRSVAGLYGLFHRLFCYSGR